jgi:ubiquinol-cytochrome c reductase subunit 6
VPDGTARSDPPLTSCDTSSAAQAPASTVRTASWTSGDFILQWRALPCLKSPEVRFSSPATPRSTRPASALDSGGQRRQVARFIERLSQLFLSNQLGSTVDFARFRPTHSVPPRNSPASPMVSPPPLRARFPPRASRPSVGSPSGAPRREHRLAGGKGREQHDPEYNPLSSTPFEAFDWCKGLLSCARTSPRASQADAEIVDPKPAIEKQCHSSCSKEHNAYESCVQRIAKKGSGTCEAWKFDYWHCIDQCTAPKLFAVLK